MNKITKIFPNLNSKPPEPFTRPLTKHTTDISLLPSSHIHHTYSLHDISRSTLLSPQGRNTNLNKESSNTYDNNHPNPSIHPKQHTINIKTHHHRIFKSSSTTRENSSNEPSYPSLPSSKIIEFKRFTTHDNRNTITQLLLKKRNTYINHHHPINNTHNVSSSNNLSHSFSIPNINIKTKKPKHYLDYTRQKIDFLLNSTLDNELEVKRKEFEEFKKDELITVYQSILIKKAQKSQYELLLRDILTLLDISRKEYELKKEILTDKLKAINANFKLPYKDDIVYNKDKKFIIQQETSHMLNEIKHTLQTNEQQYETVKNELEPLQHYNCELITNLKNEISLLKRKYTQNISDQKYYFTKLLSKGVDSRKDGISWIVIRLYEINVDVTHEHFPDFLPKESVDYVLDIAMLEHKKRLLSSMLDALRLRHKDKSASIRNMSKERSIRFTQLNHVFSKFSEKLAPKTISKENVERFETIYTKYVKLIKDRIINVVEDITIQSHIDKFKAYFKHLSQGENDSKQKLKHVHFLNRLKQIQDPDLMELISLRNTVKNLDRVIAKKVRESAMRFKKKLLGIDQTINIFEYQKQQEIYKSCFGSRLVL
jgi:hypothetical protein